jgi:DinB superfamily
VTGRPDKSEAAAYYFRYIDRVPRGDVVAYLDAQLTEVLAVLQGISEERSLHRYAQDKWNIRQLWNHVTDTERVFLYRALWFARGFADALPSFEQEPAAAAAGADGVAWARHVEEFRAVRQATVAFFRNLPAEAWSRSGIASGNPVTVRALAFIAAGHADHHASVLRERYL